MFDFLKRGEYKINIELDRGPDSAYRPGETINVAVNLLASKALPIQKGQLTLHRKEEYLTKQNETIYEDGITDSRDVYNWKETETQIAQVDFLGEMVVNQRHAVVVPITIPEQSPPNYNGEIIKISYYARVIIGRKNRFDLEAVILFKLLLPEIPCPINRVSGSSSRPDDLNLAFYLPQDSWDFDQPLSGELKVQALKEIEVTKLRIELIRSEWVHGRNDNVYAQTFACEPWGEMNLEPNELLTVPFELTAAWPHIPTFETRSYAVSWTLKATLFRPWRKDTYLKEEIVAAYPELTS